MKLNELLSFFPYNEKEIILSNDETCTQYTLINKHREVIFCYLDGKFFAIKYKRYDKIIELDSIEEAVNYPPTV